MSKIELQSVSVKYDDQPVVHDVSLTVGDGKIGCLLGPSGCGKTTLLRAIAGFQPVAAGSILLGEVVISSPTLQIAPEKRNIGMVFQDYALFPHLSIADNISFGMSKFSRKEKASRVAELLVLVNLAGYEKRYPHELSGGQQQRIALARALAPRPRLLLLDEPFGSQDVELRELLAREVRGILKREGVTAILVTHDQHEAFAMADEIGVFNHGRLQQWDTGFNLYHRPVNSFVAGFIGQGALISGRVIDGNTILTPLGKVKGEIPGDCEHDCPVDVLIRPDDIQVLENDTGAARKASVVSRLFRGSHFLYTLELTDGSRILALTPSHQVHEPGEIVNFNLDMQHLVILQKHEKDVAGVTTASNVE